MSEYIEGLNDTHLRMEKALAMGFSKDSGVFQDLQLAYNVLYERLTKMVRKTVVDFFYAHLVSSRRVRAQSYSRLMYLS